MDNITIILLTVVGIILIPIYFFYWLKRRRKEHLITIEKDWIKFNKAITNNHLEGIIEFGKEVVWNEHFSIDKLKEMSKLINEFERNNIGVTKNVTLKELKLLIYNQIDLE